MTPATTTPKKAVTNTSIIPPVGDLIKETWEITKTKWKPFLKVMVIFTGIGIVLAIALFAIFMSLGVASMIASGSLLPLVTTPIVLIAFIVWAAFSLIIGSIASIAMYRLAYGEVDETMPVMDLIKSSTQYVVPVIIAGLIAGVLVMGGIFTLVVPGIIFAILFAFAPMEVIFQGKSPVEAIKGSASLVKQHFSTIFVRWLAFIGLMMVAGVLMSVLQNLFGQGSVLFGLLQLVYNFVAGIFSTIYFVLLYKQVRAATHETQTTSLLWMIVVAVIGWIMGLLFFGSIIAGLASYMNSNPEVLQMKDFTNEEFYQEFESLNEEYNFEETPLVPEEAI